MQLQNHFIIGLGGTGGAAVKAFREIIAENREKLCQQSKQKYKFAFLYVDSNSCALHESTRWTHQGKDISLQERTETQHIALTCPERELPAICEHPNIKKWIGDISYISNTATHRYYHSNTGGHRRYGRLLTVRHSTDIKHCIQRNVAQFIHSSSGSSCFRPDNFIVTFHIFASPGGGTGSGSLMDILSLLPECCKTVSACCLINIYLLAEEINGTPVTEFFHCNQYTTLRDLNAMVTGHYWLHRDIRASINSIYISAPQNRGPLDTQVKQLVKACFGMLISNKLHTKILEYSHLTPFGEKSEIESTPYSEHVIQKIAHFYETPERANAFRTLSCAHIKHPAEELHGILACTMAGKILEHWIHGNASAGNKHEASTLSFIQETLPAILNTQGIQMKDKDFLNEILSNYRKEVERLKNKRFCQMHLHAIKACAQKQCDIIIEQSRETARQFESFCWENAHRLRDSIISNMEQHLVWSAKTLQQQAPIWGISNLIDTLSILREELQKTYHNNYEYHSEHLKKLEFHVNESEKLGILTTRFTNIPQKMLNAQAEAGEAYIREIYLQHRIEDIIRHRNDLLFSLLDADIEFYSRTISALRSQQKQLKRQINDYREQISASVIRHTAPGIYETDDTILIWNENALQQHEAYYNDDTGALSQIASAMTDCEVLRESSELLTARYRNKQSENSISVQASLLVQKLTTPESGKAWIASDRIHEKLSQSLGSAYAHNIWGYISQQDQAWETALLKSVDLYCQPGATTEPDFSNGPRLKSGNYPYKIAIVLHSGTHEPTDSDIAHRILQGIHGMLSTRRLDSILSAENYDSNEIQVIYTEGCIPLRFFRLTKYLHALYHDVINDEQKKSIRYFSNIDDTGMLDPCPNRPDLIPETNAQAHIERERIRASYNQESPQTEATASS